ncbi:MAG: hypothetical protein QOK71_10910, partial [Nitrososphaeraceae archaeon]|nr:hypothetical protein [Nitrososphaeraceae archaeon]
RSCNSKHLRNNFNKWTSGSINIDKFVQKIQLTADSSNKVIEWIPYHRLKVIKYVTKGGFGSVYSAFGWMEELMIRTLITNNGIV